MTDSDKVPACLHCAQVVDSECAPTFQDYVAVDTTLAAAGELTKEDIVAQQNHVMAHRMTSRKKISQKNLC